MRGIGEGIDGSMYFISGPGLYRKRSEDEAPVKVANLKSISGLAISKQSGIVYFRDEGLVRYNPNNGIVTSVPQPFKFIPNTFAWSLYDSGDSLWIGDDAGLWTYGPAQDRSRIFDLYNGFDEFRNSEKYHIAKRNSRELFVLTSKGLFILDRIKGVTAAYGMQFKGKFNLPAENFYHNNNAG